MYRITNMHGTVIWEGTVHSFHAAWQKMFEVCKYPPAARVIVTEINQGMWIERIDN